MSLHDDIVPLEHMRDFAIIGANYAESRTREDLDREFLQTLGLMKLVENIGEAASRVSPQTRELAPEIPWRLIIAARNRLVHGYDKVNHDVLWRILKVELPLLAAQLEELLGGMRR